MKTNKPANFLKCILIFLIFPVVINAQDLLIPETLYYAVEINGVVCGYSETSEKLIEKDGKKVIDQDGNIFIMLSLLGSEFNTEMKMKALLDPLTRRNNFINMDIKQGSNIINIEMNIKDNRAFIKSSMNPVPKEIEIVPGILIGSDEVFLQVKKDILGEGKTEVSYNILEIMEGEIQNSTFRKLREEKIDVAGKPVNTVVIEQVNNKTGMKTVQWFSPEYDYQVRVEVLNRKIYLSDQTIIDKIKVANMDANIFTKTNVAISDIQSISFMKINAVIEPTGINLKSEDLNVPGQKFTGTISNNHIEGVFEISYKKYNGENAPPFPYEYKDESLARYLSPGERVESDDPVLIKKAREITEGSVDSWDAAKRLSKWVAENIHYAIPGGGTPRKTYDTKAGECGAHSFLLATFCRTVGIPARVVWGAMYAPNFGGGFGQHGWNEIYMGDAGWIPVDATAFEIDFVDAGHIRISDFQSAASMFNGKKFEILDYKLSGQKTETAAAKYSQYFGNYTHIEAGRTFEVLEKEGNLSVNIPGQMVLPFNEMDEKGRCYCKLNPNLYIEFGKDDNNSVNELIFHEMVVMTKKSSPDSIDEKVPEELRPYLGKYLFAQANAEFTVFYSDYDIVIDNPLEKKTFKLQSPNDEGAWLDEYNKNTFYFIKDDKGIVTDMKIDAKNTFIKGELASGVIEKIINTEGIDKAVIKYKELKSASDGELIFTERSFNLLGYKLLNDKKNNEAIEIFKLNAETYPESSNVYDSLGEAYMKSGNNELAVKNYEKSLELNPANDNAKKMLESIKGNK